MLTQKKLHGAGELHCHQNRIEAASIPQIDVEIFGITRPMALYIVQEGGKALWNVSGRSGYAQL
jgi:hypothetical protein